MSHKKETLTWYSLFLRISKMRLGDAKKRNVCIKIGGTLHPVTIEYEQSGATAYLVLSGEERIENTKEIDDEISKKNQIAKVINIQPGSGKDEKISALKNYDVRR